MPELPEVETVRIGLDRLIVGKTIKSVKHNSDKSFPNNQSSVDQFMIGSQITGVRRRAKVLLIDLSTEYTVMVHLKMTGQMVFVKQKQDLRSESFDLGGLTSIADHPRPKTLDPTSAPEERWGAGHPNNSLVDSLPDKSTRVSIEFSDGTNLYFNDQRRFGWVKLLPTELVSQEPFMLKVGPEPLEPEFTADVFIPRVRRRKGTSIKAAILDQTVLAGVGNIYADESLWSARIHPAVLVKDLSDDQLRVLHTEIIDVMNLSIQKGGSTNKNYVNAEGKKGSYMDFANVFRREGLPCNRCQTTIEKSRVAARGTHACTKCQILTK